MKTFYVSIDKAYFKKEEQEKVRFGQIYETVKIKAYCGTDAIRKAWTMKGEQWLALMPAKQTSKRIISLYVTQDKNLSRQIPFKAYED